MRFTNRTNKGFTLVEMLAVLVILVTLAAVVVPRFINAGMRSKEAALKATLGEVRNAITMFRNDTGYFPAQLDDIAATTAPAQGRNKYNQLRDIDPLEWKGPYLDVVPNDPVSKQPLQYYRNAQLGVWTVRSSAPGRAEDGTNYNTW